jgi:hypothetical protein
MPMVDYTCPECKRVILATTNVDENTISILFEHIRSYHKDFFNIKS